MTPNERIAATPSRHAASNGRATIGCESEFIPALATIRARFDARQHGRRQRTMQAHRQARSRSIQAEREAQLVACDYFNATDYGTRADALEARYALLRHDRLEVVATMAHEGHNGSRAAMVRPTNLSLAETVNATEIRVLPRWTLDRPSKVEWPTKWDGTCYSIIDGCREAFTPNTDEDAPRKRRTAPSTTHDEHNARMLAIVGGSQADYD